MTQLCTFTVDGALLGVGIEHVLEVSRDDVVTPVPLAPPSVVGVLNLRGRIVTAVDARRRLGFPAGTAGPVAVVISAGGESVGLLVDRQGEVVDVDDSMKVALPATVEPSLRSCTTSSYLVDGATVIVLDPDMTLLVASS